ncbi:hypothetical protein M3P05_07195 [Sansalvadorimonas sp. 2012CJ34-2]|uniref:DUF4124 domain-containing protein n=1 Tax=Parendozoicomonas callyspongiae TaxID=2942213 RepID=A0ABT0PEI7_9GAMM|nr:hypothetical protein [Sansalvadorimonas sp. 2012CJ34-2]MCL6269723.1 hypothetical protein [Sansalvadorimonas sp. 2012CJ34-2]
MEFNKKIKAIKKSVFLVLAAFGYLSISDAAEYTGQYFYRYVDKNGETVIATQVPKEAAKRGYEVLTDTGRVLETVAPQLSDEAIQIQKFQKQLTLQKKLREKKQSESDEELLRLYSSADDVEFALRRLLQEIDTRILVLTSNTERLKLQQERKQAEAARLERGGKKVPQNLLTELKNIAAELFRIQIQAQEYNKEKDKMRAEYALKAERVRFLVEGEEVSRNKNLLFTDKQVIGNWRPVGKHPGVIRWSANPEGRFILQVSKSERLVGNWSFSRDKDIVVVYFRQETIKNGKESRKPLAKEERYPVLDFQDGVLSLFWGEKSEKFQKDSQ